MQTAQSNQVPQGDWFSEGLETVEFCPACGASERSPLHTGLEDRIFFCAPGQWTMYRCEKCGAGYLDPRPNEETIGRAYASYYTHGHESREPQSKKARLIRAIRNGYLNRTYGYKLKPALAAAAPLVTLMPGLRCAADESFRCLKFQPSSTALLDVGSGSGDFIQKMQQAGWNAAGLDFDPSAVEFAQAERLNVQLGTLQPGQYEKASWDAITLNHVIEHLHHPAEMLRLCYDYLKPGGVLWIATPNLNSEGHREFGKFWRGLEPPRHLTVFSLDSLRGMLERTGFEGRQAVRYWPAKEMYRQSAAIASGIPMSEFLVLPSALKRRARQASLKTFVNSSVCEHAMVIGRKPV